MDKLTQDYYTNNAKDFAAATFDVDVSPIRERFLKYIPVGGRILDAGCGSGRDALAFSQAGYAVSAFDAIPEMVEEARQRTGMKVECTTFQKLDALRKYDGVWASASLLHVPLIEMADVFLRLSWALTPSGTLYCSFKLGEGEVERNGRTFSCFTNDSFLKFLDSSPFEVNEIWASTDVRVGREDEVWLNTILTVT